MSGIGKMLLPMLALAAVVGCKSAQPELGVLLTTGERAYHNQNYTSAIDHLSRFIDQGRQPDKLARARYVRGMAAARAGRRALAYSDLEQAAREAPDSQIVWSVEAALGILHFEDEHWETAAGAFSRAVARMPTVPPMDALLYRLGLCRERSGRWSEALAAYDDIVKRFARGHYAAHARRRLQLRANHFAVQCGVFASVENAQRLAGELQRSDMRAYVRREARAGRDYYVVLAGRYNSFSQAKQALARAKGHVPKAVLWP